MSYFDPSSIGNSADLSLLQCSNAVNNMQWLKWKGYLGFLVMRIFVGNFSAMELQELMHGKHA